MENSDLSIMTNEDIKRELSKEETVKEIAGVPMPTVAAGLLNHELMIEHLKKNTNEPLEFDSLFLADEELRKRFGARIRIMRNFLGLTQAELAEKVGVSKQAIATYETGKREPPFRNLIRLARIFKVSADWLLGEPPPVLDSRMPF